MRIEKRIAFFVPSLNIGGVESVFITYSSLLAAKGYIVDFVVCKAEGILRAKLSSRVRLVDLGGIQLRYAFLRLRRYLLTQDVDTLICGPDITNFIAILVNRSLPRKRRVNLIVSQHNLPDPDIKDLGFIGRLIPLGKRLLYPYATTVMSVSENVSQHLREIGIPIHKIVTVRNPISFAEIETHSRETPAVALPDRYILFVGRLYAVKNVELLIRAFAELDDPALNLVIVGDGPLCPALESLARDTQADSRILFTGALPNPAPVIRRSSVVAIPSFSEAFPMVAIEAAALGKTIVHTPNPGCREILGDGNSYCSDTFDDPHAFANLLRTAIHRPIASEKVKRIALALDESVILPQLEQLLKNKSPKTTEHS